MTINILHDAFQGGLADVRRASEQLSEDEATIDRRVTGFLGAGWTGGAAESFSEAWSDWKTAADRVVVALDAIGDLMAAAYSDLTVQDEASQTSLDQISARIIDRLG